MNDRKKASGKGPPGPPALRWTALSVSELYRNFFGNDRLLVATHREPVIYPPSPSKGSGSTARSKLRYPAGGVSQSLHRLLLQVGGDWVSLRSSGGPDRLAIGLPDSPAGYNLYRLSFENPSQEEAYQSFVNDLLWPLFHEEPGRVLEHPESFDGYDAVNRRFAEKIGRVMEDHHNGVIWIHDYQLARVATWLREIFPGPLPPLAFFWHIPWPSPSFLSLLTDRRAILSGLLDYDLLGFQTALYRDRFLESIAQEFKNDKKIRIEGRSILKDGRIISVGDFPIGVDPGRFESLSLDSQGMEEATLFLKEHGISPNDNYLISVDRMDYTKGFLKRLLILEALFQKYPEWIGKVRLLQIAPPTRTAHPTYLNYQKKVREGVQSTNNRWRKGDWEPVISIDKTVGHRILAPLYRLAAGALVTSTNDGMNLVAKEYLASQKDMGGILFLSRYTGAAQGLKEAVLIDPHDPDKSAAILHKSLTEPLSIRKGRNAILRELISRNNIYQWMGSILTALSEHRSHEQGENPGRPSR